MRERGTTEMSVGAQEGREFMENKGKVRRLLFLTAILTMLMAGCTYAASLSSRTYTLSPQGYIAWSDFSVPSSETVTINISSSVCSGQVLQVSGL